MCGPTIAKNCYLHHSFEVSDSASCSDGFALKSVSFTADGMIASPFSCCSIGGSFPVFFKCITEVFSGYLRGPGGLQPEDVQNRVFCCF